MANKREVGRHLMGIRVHIGFVRRALRQHNAIGGFMGNSKAGSVLGGLIAIAGLGPKAVRVR